MHMPLNNKTHCRPHIRSGHIPMIRHNARKRKTRQVPVVVISSSPDQKQHSNNGQDWVQRRQEKRRRITSPQSKQQRQRQRQQRQQRQLQQQQQQQIFLLEPGSVLPASARPPRPPPGSWLSDDNIHALLSTVLKWPRYENLKAIFVDPSMFAMQGPRLETALERFLTKQKSWKRAILPINTGGGHWVLIFIDRTKKHPGLEYYDSFGVTPTDTAKRVWNILNKLNHERKLAPVELEKFISKKVRQRQGVECGMFVLWTAMLRLVKSRKGVEETNFDDAQCNVMRAELFNPDQQLPFVLPQSPPPPPRSGRSSPIMIQ